MHNNLLIASARDQEMCDILMTKSPRLLTNGAALIEHANPRTPIEAARIVGLFLRSRSDFMLETEGDGMLGVTSDGFNRVLTRFQLPSMWRYFRAYVRAEDKSMGWSFDEPLFSFPYGSAIRVRLSMFMRREEEGWKIVHAHFSVGVPDEEVVALQKKWQEQS